MARNIASHNRLMTSILALLMLTTTAICFLQVGERSEPDLRAHTMEAWPSGTIVVNVTDEIGRMIAGATVRTIGNGISWQNQTGSDGSVTISTLPADDNVTDGLMFLLNASMAGYKDSANVPQNVSENTTKYVTLVILGGSILGTVKTSISGVMVPVEGANVSIASLGYSTIVSPTTGAYALRGIPAGTHVVTANASGYKSSPPVTVVVTPGGSEFLEFVLVSETGSISGHVYHATLHTPLNNTNVSVQIGTFTKTVVSGSDGSFNLTEIPEGTYALTAEKEGFLSAVITNIVVLRGNRTLGADFNLTEKPTRLYGVVRSGSLLLVGVNVSVVGEDVYALSEADGSYEIGNLTAGTYVVTATLQGYETQTINDAVIPPGGQVQLNINLTSLPGAAVRGVVKDSKTGEPMASVLVTVVNLSPQPLSRYTNIFGEFEFPALIPGNYTLRFERTGYRPIEIENIDAEEGSTKIIEFQMTPLRNSFEGFMFGFDLPHSMMMLALILIIIIFLTAVYLRVRTFMAPESAPAVYDEVEEEAPTAEGERAGQKPEEPEN